MFLNLKKTLFLVGSSALLFTGCGDDGGGTPDAAVTVIDADTTDAMPDLTFSGSISIAEVGVVNAEAAAIGGLYGSGIIINFDDPLTVIPPHPDFPQPVAACKVTVTDIDGGDVVPDEDDGGAINVTGTGAGEFNCAFNATLEDYLCATADAAGMGALPINTTIDVGQGGNPNATVNITVPGADFSNVNYVGMYIVPNGFGNAAVDMIPYPVVGVPADDTLTLFNVGQLPGNNDLVLAAAGTYFTTIGDPIASALGPYDTFLAGTQDVTITKAAVTNSPAITATVKPYGDGFTFADDSESPDDFPASGAVRFSCDEAQNGVCGSQGDSGLQGLVIFGETTDTTLPTGSPADFKEMPEPTGKYATFSCSGLNAKEMTIPAEAVALIMGTNPTRIKTTVTYTNASIETGGKVNVVLAHGLAGFSDAPFTAP